MARRLIWTGLALLAVLALASTAVAQGMCERVGQDRVDRWNAGDAAGVADLYTEDGVLRHANAVVVRGREQIQASTQGSIDAGITLEATEDSLESVAEGVMVGLGEFALFHANGEMFVGGEYMAVYVVRDGTCYFHRHFTGTVPPGQM